MRLRRREEGQMVARVGVERGQDGQGEPEPGRGHVRAHDQHAQERGQQVREDVFQRVAIDGGHGDGGRPLVVLLVDVLVQVL